MARSDREFGYYRSGAGRNVQDVYPVCCGDPATHVVWRFQDQGLENEIDGLAHLTLLMGGSEGKGGNLVRVHSAALTGDALHSLRCDCGDQLQAAMERVASEGEGVIVYMQQEGRGIGPLNKMKAYHLQYEGLDTVEADQRLVLAPDLRDCGIGPRS
jgi:3,4-dihydroxy 2-butanone 4-phosphate synthase/GTP cyclohydrolase II